MRWQPPWQALREANRGHLAKQDSANVAGVILDSYCGLTARSAEKLVMI